MYRQYEVEITRKFNDATTRIDAMLFFHKMLLTWENPIKLEAVILEPTQISWRFSFNGNRDADEFNNLFDPPVRKESL